MKSGGIEQSGRLEVGGDLHDLVVGPREALSLIARPDRVAPRPGHSSVWDFTPALSTLQARDEFGDDLRSGLRLFGERNALPGP